MHLSVLKAIARTLSPERLVKDLTSWLLYAEDDRKFLYDITVRSPTPATWF